MKIQEAEYTEVLKLRHESMYPDASIDLAKVENDDQGIHLGAFEGGEMVACVSIFLEGRNLQFRKLATKPKHRNKGYATELIKYLIDYHFHKDEKYLDYCWEIAAGYRLTGMKSFGEDVATFIEQEKKKVADN